MGRRGWAWQKQPAKTRCVRLCGSTRVCGMQRTRSCEHGRLASGASWVLVFNSDTGRRSGPRCGKITQCLPVHHQPPACRQHRGCIGRRMQQQGCNVCGRQGNKQDRLLAAERASRVLVFNSDTGRPRGGSPRCGKITQCLPVHHRPVQGVQMSRAGAARGSSRMASHTASQCKWQPSSSCTRATSCQGTARLLQR